MECGDSCLYKTNRQFSYLVQQTLTFNRHASTKYNLLFMLIFYWCLLATRDNPTSTTEQLINQQKWFVFFYIRLWRFYLLLFSSLRDTVFFLCRSWIEQSIVSIRGIWPRVLTDLYSVNGSVLQRFDTVMEPLKASATITGLRTHNVAVSCCLKLWLMRRVSLSWECIVGG